MCSERQMSGADVIPSNIHNSFYPESVMHLQQSNNDSQVCRRQVNGVSSEEVTPVVRHGRRINEEGYAVMNSLLDSHLDLLKQELEKHKRAPSFGNNHD